MNQNMNEDVMWARLKDIQMEVENGRLDGSRPWPSAARLVTLLGVRAWHIAGLAARRAPRRHPAAGRVKDLA